MDLYMVLSVDLPHELCLELIKFVCMRNLRTYITNLGADFEELCLEIMKFVCMRNLRTYITNLGIDFDQFCKLINKYHGV